MKSNESYVIDQKWPSEYKLLNTIECYDDRSFCRG